MQIFQRLFATAASEAELRYGPLENRSSLLQHTTVKETVRNRNIVIYGHNVCIYYGLILYLYYWYYATTTVQKPHPSICPNLKLKLISSDLHTVLDLLHLLFAHFNMWCFLFPVFLYLFYGQATFSAVKGTLQIKMYYYYCCNNSVRESCYCQYYQNYWNMWLGPFLIILQWQLISRRLTLDWHRAASLILLAPCNSCLRISDHQNNNN